MYVSSNTYKSANTYNYNTLRVTLIFRFVSVDDKFEILNDLTIFILKIVLSHG